MSTYTTKNPSGEIDIYSALGISQTTQDEMISQLRKVVGPNPGPVPSIAEVREMLQKEMGDRSLSEVISQIRDEE